jgi:hypothetical protein
MTHVSMRYGRASKGFPLEQASVEIALKLNISTINKLLHTYPDLHITKSNRKTGLLTIFTLLSINKKVKISY